MLWRSRWQQLTIDFRISTVYVPANKTKKIGKSQMKE